MLSNRYVSCYVYVSVCSKQKAIKWHWPQYKEICIDFIYYLYPWIFTVSDYHCLQKKETFQILHFTRTRNVFTIGQYGFWMPFPLFIVYQNSLGEVKLSTVYNFIISSSIQIADIRGGKLKGNIWVVFKTHIVRVSFCFCHWKHNICRWGLMLRGRKEKWELHVQHQVSGFKEQSLLIEVPHDLESSHHGVSFRWESLWAE